MKNTSAVNISKGNAEVDEGLAIQNIDALDKVDAWLLTKEILPKEKLS